MAYRQPTTTVSFYEGVPLDNTYNNTIYFATKAEQSAYFATYVEGVTKQTYNDLTFQRVSNNVIRVQANASDMWAFNYMSFANLGFGTFDHYKDKVWYAFVTDIKYINENTAEVTYQIDVMQSWMFDYELGVQYVEREMAVQDYLGENILPEPVNCGEYVFNDYADVTPELDLSAVVFMLIPLSSDEGQRAYVINSILTGCLLEAYICGTSDEVLNPIRNLLESYAETPDNIIGCYMCPVFAITGLGEAWGTTPMIIDSSIGSKTKEYRADGINTGTSLNGYVPHNRKLYTYPYNFYHIDNANSGSLTLRYEFFNNLYPEWEISATVTPPVEVRLRPKNYKDVPTGTFVNNESISIDNYPQCSFNIDSYAAWLAQNSVPSAIHLATSTLTGVTKAVTSGNILSGVNSVIGEAANIATQAYEASIAGDIYKGNVSTGNGNISRGIQTFYGGRMSVSYSYAKMIDSFFDRFGYNTMALKVPNTHSRPHWNYVKTNGCSLEGHLPAQDLKEIEQIYDRGITFWRNGSEVGNYDLDNSPE